MVNLVRHGVDAIFGSGTGSTTGNYYRKTRWRSEIVEAIYCDAAGTGTYNSYAMNVGDANGSGGPNLGDFSIETLMATGQFAPTVIYGSNANVMFEVDSTTPKLRLVKPGSHQLGLGNTVLSARTWYHMAVTFDGAGVAFYLNGVPDGTATSSTTFANAQYGLLVRPGSGTYQGTSGGYLAYTAVWDRVLSPAEMFERARNPWGIFQPVTQRRLYFFASAAGHTVTVNQALETDLAQAITRLKAKTLGQATETDLAQAITRRKTLAIGQTLETDLAQAVAHAKAKLLGQATETDTAQAVAHAKTKALGQATETDLAQAITVSGNKIIAVGQVTETDVAQSLTARKAKQLGQTTETDLAQAVAHAKTKALGQATETDLAQAITPSIPNQVGQAVETDLAQTITRLKTKALGQTTETDLAQAITHAKTKGLGLALEIDLGQPIALAPKRRLVAQATETDLAQTIVPSLSSVLLPQGKRYVVGARVGYRVGARNNFRVDQ